MPNLIGKVTLGLDGPTPADTWFPFLNLWKISDEFEITTSGSNKQSALPPNTANSAWLDSVTAQAYLDANGELINPLPADASTLIRRFETHSSNIITIYTGRYGEEWVLKFDGVATSVVIAWDNVVRVGNRITGTWPANQSNKQVNISGIDHNDPPRNFRLCPLKWEPLLDGGEIFNPEWLAEVRRGSGIIRFMDWMATNKNRSTRTFAEIPTESYYTWGSGLHSSDPTSTYLQGGMPLSVMSNLAKRCNSHAWVCFPHVFGTPKTAKVTGITKANPAAVTSANHPFINGDQVIIYLVGGMNEVNRNTYTVANATTDTFELSGIDSTGFTTFTSLGWLTSPYSLTGMTTEVTKFATYFRDNVSDPLKTYFEFSNECWNSIFDSFHWLAAQARAKFAGDNSYKMTGYLLAHCMKTVRDVYGVSNRSRWRGVAATFSLGAGVTNDILSGINTYITEEAPSLTLNDLVDDIAVVGYWGGNLAGNGTVGAVTINIGTSTFTRNSHGYLEGNPLKFTTTDTLPIGVTSGTFYYVKNVTTNTFQISATSGGSVITLSGSQAGTHTVNKVPGDLSQKWLDDSITRFNSGLEKTKYAYFSRIVNEDLYNGLHSGLQFSITNSEVILHTPNKTVADANGLGLIQYEGGNSNALNDFAGGSRNTDSQWREFFPESVHNPDDAANYTNMMNAFTTLGGAFPAKFTEANADNIFGSFGGMKYPGDTNPTWEAVCAYNDKIWAGRLT